MKKYKIFLDLEDFGSINLGIGAGVDAEKALEDWKSRNRLVWTFRNGMRNIFGGFHVIMSEMV